MIIKKTFKISGMHCTSCSLMIDGDLEDTEGVLSSSTNYAKQESVVSFDTTKLSAQKILEIIKFTGYDAQDDSS